MARPGKAQFPDVPRAGPPHGSRAATPFATGSATDRSPGHTPVDDATRRDSSVAAPVASSASSAATAGRPATETRAIGIAGHVWERSGLQPRETPAERVVEIGCVLPLFRWRRRRTPPSAPKTVSPPPSASILSAWFVPTMKSEPPVPLKLAATAIPVKARKASATPAAVCLRLFMKSLPGSWLDDRCGL